MTDSSWSYGGIVEDPNLKTRVPPALQNLETQDRLYQDALKKLRLEASKRGVDADVPETIGKEAQLKTIAERVIRKDVDEQQVREAAAIQKARSERIKNVAAIAEAYTAGKISEDERDRRITELGPRPDELQQAGAMVQGLAGGAAEETRAARGSAGQQTAPQGYGGGDTLGGLKQEHFASTSMTNKNIGKAQEDTSKSLNEYAEAVQTQGDEQTLMAIEQANARARAMNEWDRGQAEREARAQEKRDAMADARQRYQQIQTSVQNKTIDPRRLFKSTGSKILAAISVAMAEFGRALTGGSTNTALEIINKAIDDDIMAQQSEIDKMKDQANFQGNLLSMMRDEYGDELEAQKASRIALLEHIASTSDTISAEHAGPIEAAKAKSVAALARKQIADETIQAEERAYDKATRDIGFRAGLTVQGAQLAQNEARMSAPDKDSAKQQQRAQNARRLMAEVRKAYSEKGSLIQYPKDRRTFALAIAQQLNPSGRYSEALVDEIENALPGRFTPKGMAEKDFAALDKIIAINSGNPFIASEERDSDVQSWSPDEGEE